MDKQGTTDVRKLTLSEVTFIGVHTYSPIDLQATVQELHSEALGWLERVEQRALSDGATAFDDLRHGRTAAAKTVLNPYACRW